ncbi:hypothetical protein BY996DRAFT_6464093 [Phakopsora pachyrhizi]|nr:hypothetical protein BY996DRAFT_6464093 [Phakopsora pachyrhizi]
MARGILKNFGSLTTERIFSTNVVFSFGGTATWDLKLILEFMRREFGSNIVDQKRKSLLLNNTQELSENRELRTDYLSESWNCTVVNQTDSGLGREAEGKEFDRYFEREEVEERGDDLGVYRVFEPLVDTRHMLLFGLPDERMDGLDLHSTESSPGAQHLASDNSKQEVVVEFDDELVPIFSQKAFKKLQTLLKKS